MPQNFLQISKAVVADRLHKTSSHLLPALPQQGADP
jgi:hypothetical protein